MAATQKSARLNALGENDHQLACLQKVSNSALKESTGAFRVRDSMYTVPTGLLMVPTYFAGQLRLKSLPWLFLLGRHKDATIGHYQHRSTICCIGCIDRCRRRSGQIDVGQSHRRNLALQQNRLCGRTRTVHTSRSSSEDHQVGHGLKGCRRTLRSWTSAPWSMQDSSVSAHPNSWVHLRPLSVCLLRRGSVVFRIGCGCRSSIDRDPHLLCASFPTQTSELLHVFTGIGLVDDFETKQRLHNVL